MTEEIKKHPLLLILFVVYGSLFIAIFNYTLSIIASIYIDSDLGGGGTSTVIYSISFFGLGNAIGIPLGGYLLAKQGILRPLLVCTILLVIFSLMSAKAITYTDFLVGRFLQGIVCGPYYAIILSLQTVVIPSRFKQISPFVNACLFIVTPTLGACWGGWIAYEWNWRVPYYIDAAMAALFAVLQYVYLRGYDEPFLKKTIKFDWMGYLSFIFALLPLGFFIIRGQELDWFRSPLLTWFFAIGLFFLIFFIIWELKTEQPILNLRLLSNSAMVFCLLHLAILFALYFGNIILLSLWLKFWVNYTSSWINLLLVNTGLAALAIIILRFYLAYRDVRLFWSIAIILLGISSYYTTYFNVDIDFRRIAISRLFAGFGLAFFLPPIFRTVYGLYPKQQFVEVIGLLQVTRALGSSLGAAIFSTLWDRRQVFFNERLVSRLTTLSPITEEYYTLVGAEGLFGEAATARLSYFSQREASSLALDDIFYLMTWILVGLLFSFAYTYFLPKRVFNP